MPVFTAEALDADPEALAFLREVLGEVSQPSGRKIASKLSRPASVVVINKLGRKPVQILRNRIKSCRLIAEQPTPA
ncbi:hypothetical protein MPEAHAMD_6109 [Methylobacterium frigidaeris]|uniref:Uncharacterized protein n=1 Tax=Methylobacterium frigidaeris TaxID=2038277 RepID=A0AA37HHC5_9HYPH|nr:hypothetical protein MPEAHAMD_6109 [Methylobacterium frigidaeris]